MWILPFRPGANRRDVRARAKKKHLPDIRRRVAEHGDDIVVDEDRRKVADGRER
jgi:hypothetical protein